MEFTFAIEIQIIVKLLLSILIGLCIGRERKKHEKSGGSRTMAIVCLSSCLIAVLSQKLTVDYTFDFVRLMQGAIQGIGFIGMGLIFKNKGDVEGLTTASTLFALMIIGFCIGLNFYLIGIISALLILFTLELKYIKKK